MRKRVFGGERLRRGKCHDPRILEHLKRYVTRLKQTGESQSRDSAKNFDQEVVLYLQAHVTSFRSRDVALITQDFADHWGLAILLGVSQQQIQPRETMHLRKL